MGVVSRGTGFIFKWDFALCVIPLRRLSATPPPKGEALPSPSPIGDTSPERGGFALSVGYAATSPNGGGFEKGRRRVRVDKNPPARRDRTRGECIKAR